MGSKRSQNGKKKETQAPRGQPIALDPDALSASPSEPAFIARPTGAPVYHGFQVLDDVKFDGFTLGKITDFRSRTLRLRRCVCDCAGQYPGGTCLGGSGAPLLRRSAASRSEPMGRVGSFLSVSNDKSRKCAT